MNFLHSSYCGAVFCICAKHSVGNIGIYSLLLRRAYIHVHIYMQILGGDRDRTADPNLSKGYPRQNGAMLST